MAKFNPFTLEDLEKKGYVRQEDGTYAKSTSDYEKAITTIKDSLRRSPAQIIAKKPTDSFPAISDGPKIVLEDETVLNHGAKPIMVFEINPMGAPRMTRSDRWKLDPQHDNPRKRQRKAVTQYFKYKNELKAQCAKYGFIMPENTVHLVFVIPMPHSWSNKKQNQMNGSPHQQRPDVDNLCKGLFDSLLGEDKHIWDVRITKNWGRSGKIVVYNI